MIYVTIIINFNVVNIIYNKIIRMEMRKNNKSIMPNL